MSTVLRNRLAAPVGVLLGGTGHAPIPAPQRTSVPALLRPWPCTNVCGTLARALRANGQ